MFPCNKMCCGFIKELPAPSTGLGKKKKSLPISHVSFACYLPPTKTICMKTIRLFVHRSPWAAAVFLLTRAGAFSVV